MVKNFLAELKEELDANGGKVPFTFVEKMLNDTKTKISHTRVTPNTRVCVITLRTGHDLVGYAQVLDAKNDVEAIGREIAYNNARDGIWAALGAIAKVL